jgi:hypothetical protein
VTEEKLLIAINRLAVRIVNEHGGQEASRSAGSGAG